MCMREVYWGELREKGQDWAEGEAELCAALIGSQPGKLKGRVAFQMSQIQARGHMALYPLCSQPLNVG